MPCAAEASTLGGFRGFTMRSGKTLQAEHAHYLYFRERQYSRPLSAHGSTLHVGSDQNLGFVWVVLDLYLDYKYL